MDDTTRKRAPRVRPVTYPIDDLWQATVLRRMDELGITRAELARKVGAVPASITLLFQADTEQSGFVPAIHQALGFLPPRPTKAVEAPEPATARGRKPLPRQALRQPLPLGATDDELASTEAPE